MSLILILLQMLCFKYFQEFDVLVRLVHEMCWSKNARKKPRTVPQLGQRQGLQLESSWVDYYKTQ